MIYPTIGRVVLVAREGKMQFQPALICFVHNDQYINVAGFDEYGYPFREQHLELRQGEVTTDPTHVPSELRFQTFACWMPYQNKQAASNR